MDCDHLYNFQSPFDRRFHIKFKENWPRVFKDMDGRRMTDDELQVITIAHPEPLAQVC